MIDWQAIATPARPVTMEFARMCRLMYRVDNPASMRDFANFMDRWDRLYFGPAMVDAIDNRRGAK